MDEVLVIKTVSWVVTIMCFLAGIGFLFFPKSMSRVSQTMNKTFHPLENLEKALEKQISDKWIVSSSKVLGVIALIISVVIFSILIMV
jgi:hypothetical protein